MLKYRPEIRIRTDLDEESKFLDSSSGESVFDKTVSKLERYSITPKTLKAITEFHPEYIAKSEYNPELYTSIEEYSHGDNKVLHYGLRSDLMTSDVRSELFKDVIFIPKGSSTVKTSAYKKDIATNARLQNLEKHILIKAINSFVEISASNTLLAQKVITAVVSFFERNSGKEINLGQDGFPITHSVVLHYNQSEKVVDVIDPNNFLFSSHLENNEFNAELRDKELPLIRTIHKELKIYTPVKEQIGYAFDKYRDCLDISVKIAFGLNIHPMDSFIFETVKTNSVIITISNNSDIDKTFDDRIYDKISVRIKQDSSLNIQNIFSKIKKVFDNKIKIFSKIDAAESEITENDFKMVLSKTSNSFEMLDMLISLNSSKNEIIKTLLEAEHADLIGFVDDHS